MARMCLPPPPNSYRSTFGAIGGFHRFSKDHDEIAWILEIGKLRGDLLERWVGIMCLIKSAICLGGVLRDEIPNLKSLIHKLRGKHDKP